MAPRASFFGRRAAVVALVATLSAALTVTVASPTTAQPSTGDPVFVVANLRDAAIAQVDVAAGSSVEIMDGDDGLVWPIALTTDDAGNLYALTNVWSPDVLRLAPDGSVDVHVSGGAALEFTADLEFGPAGDLFITRHNGEILRYDDTTSTLDLLFDIADGSGVEDTEFDAAGNIYVADNQNQQGAGQVLRVDPHGAVSIVAEDLDTPRGLAIDEARGVLYSVNQIGQTMDRIDLATGAVEEFAEVTSTPGEDPVSVVVDRDGSIHVLTNFGNIRRWAADGSGGDVIATTGSSLSVSLVLVSDAADGGGVEVRPGSATATEGDAGTTRIDVPVTLSEPSPDVVTVDFRTRDGTATAGADYLATTGTITFPPGETSASVAVDVLGDVIDEPDEQLWLLLHSPQNAVVRGLYGIGAATIIDDEIGVRPHGVLVEPEGTGGSTIWQLPVYLSEPAPDPVSIDWATVDIPENPRVAASGSDYVGAAGTLVFAPGETVQHVPLEILGDASDELPLLWGEWGVVVFTNPSANVVLDTNNGFFGAGLFIIIDDD